MRRLKFIFTKPVFVIAAFISAMTMPVSAYCTDSELIVSAAMSLRSAFEKIAEEYENRNPGVRVSLNLSSSGKLRQQIEAGAPVDVFASASKRHMDNLEEKGLIDVSSRKNIAGNTIVLCAGAGSTLNDFGDLGGTGINRIALGNPETSPAGGYAKETLVSLGLWERIKDRLVYVENVRQVLDYLSRNEVDAGLLYASDAALKKVEVKVIASAPAGTHADIVYPIAVVKESVNHEAAEKFIELVNSSEGRAIMEAAGFLRL